MADSAPGSAGTRFYCRLKINASLSVFFACALAVSCSSSSDSFLGFSPSALQEGAAVVTGEQALSESGTATEDTKPEAQSAALQPSSPAAQATDGGEDLTNTETSADEAESKGEQTAAGEAPSPAETKNPPKPRGVFANLFAASGQAANEAAREPASGESVAPTNQAEATGGQEDEARAAAGAETEENKNTPAKRSFLSAFFAPANAKTEATTAEAEQEEADEPEPNVETVSLASRPEAKPSAMWDDPLPGVRSREQLFEISRGSGTDDDSDIDLYEQTGSYEVASAAGLARLAPNGLLKQRESVDVSCFKPQLVRMLKIIERHFGKRVVVTSGYRSPAHNRRVRGARNSMHMQCSAADIQVAGVDRWELARFTRALPSRGGVGTYCHTKSVHVDVGPKRDWNWRCRR